MFWSIALGGAIGFLSAIFAAPIRDLIYRPKLELSFSGEEDCIAETSESTEIDSKIRESWDAIYLRVRVQNKSKRIAKSCIAYLVGVEKQDEHGDFVSTIYVDSIPLAWSCRGEAAYSEIDIPYGTSQYVDVLKTSDRQDFVFPRWPLFPHRYVSLFNKEGTYRLTVLVAGDGIEPAMIKLIFVWKRRWDTFEAHEAK